MHKTADPMENAKTRMGNVNMGDDQRKEHELNLATNANLEEKFSDDTVENVLGSVHISQPSIQRVFFLLRPILNPILKQFAKLETDLGELVSIMKLERVFLDQPIAISGNVGYTLDYKNRKYLYIMTSNPNFPIIQVNGVSLSQGMTANVWYPLHYPQGSVITVAGQSDASPIPFTIRACDIPQAMYTYSLFGGQVALASSGNVIGKVTPTSDYPSSAIPITADSGNQANAIATATLGATAAKTTYITGFEVTGTGATAALVVTVTIVGTITGTLHYTYVFVAGATTPNTPLIVEFSRAIPASALNTTIAVSCPASGTGGTNNTVVAHGYQL